MDEKNFVGKIFRQSLIVYILSDIAYTAGPLVDGIVTGNYLGVEAVAAISLIAPSIFIFSFIVCILASGSQSVCTALFGQGKVDEANYVFTLANIFGVIASLAIMSCILLFPHSIMRFLGATGANSNLETYGADYLSGYAFGLAFMYCARILHGFMNLDNDNSRTFYAITAMTITNIIGDFYVVLFTDAGIFGLALATSLSNVVYFAVLAMHFLRKKRIVRLNFRPSKNILSVLLNICKQGSMSALTRVSKFVAGILINHIIIFYTTSYELAVYGVQNQMLNLFGAVYLGTADTLWVLASVYYGEEDIKSLDDLQVTSMTAGISIAVICSLVIFTFSKFFAGLYLGRENLQVLEMGSEAVRYVAFVLSFYVFIFCFVNYLQGVKRFFAANIFIVIIQVIVPVSVIYATVKLSGGGSWRAAPVSACILSIFCALYIYLRKVPITVKKRLMLDKNFYGDPGQELHLVADSELEVIGMSRIAQLFCMENDFDKKTAMRLALCIEELGMNIIQHGFNDGKDHYIYLRILAKDDKLILRMRDDCVLFNPLEYYKMASQNEDDPTKGLGIKIVMKMCSEIIYVSMFRTNNLILTILKGSTERQAKYKFIDSSQNTSRI